MPLTAILARFVLTVESDTYSRVPHEASGIKVVVSAGGHNYEGLSGETAAALIKAMQEAALNVLRELAELQRDEGPETGEALLTDVTPSADEILASRRAELDQLRRARKDWYN